MQRAISTGHNDGDRRRRRCSLHRSFNALWASGGLNMHQSGSSIMRSTTTRGNIPSFCTCTRRIPARRILRAPRVQTDDDARCGAAPRRRASPVRLCCCVEAYQDVSGTEQVRDGKHGALQSGKRAEHESRHSNYLIRRHTHVSCM